MIKNMKRLFKFTATAAVSLAVLCTAGVTLALETSASRSSGSLTTAGLELSATAKNVKVYNAVPAPSAADEADKFYDEHKNAYVYEQSAVQGDAAGKISFTSHEGGVSFNEKSVTVENFTPGDKVEFDIEVTSKSTISFDYRAELYVNSKEGQTLLNQLDFSAGKLGLKRTDVTDDDALKDGELAAAVITDYTEWNKVGANKPDVEKVHVSVSFPITATAGMGETVKFYYVARGIQNTEIQSDVAELTTADGKNISFKKLADAVEYAQNYGVDEIRVKGSTVLEEGTMEISNALKFKGVADENGNFPVLKGARFVIKNGSAANFEKIVFGGDSYIDVTEAAALTVKDCDAFVTPAKCFDSAARDYLDGSAFLVSGTSRTAVRLNMENCVISGGDSAINLRAPVYSGSVLSGNTFGTEKAPFDTAVALNGAYDVDGGEPFVTVTGNEFRGKRALYLGGNSSYLTVSKDNAAFGCEGIFVGGSAFAAFADGGSKTDGKALECKNIGTLAFGGVDTVLNSINRVVSGKIQTNISFVPEFWVRYAAGSTVKKNAIALYSGGALYAYLNAADGDAGYVIDAISD